MLQLLCGMFCNLKRLSPVSIVDRRLSMKTLQKTTILTACVAVCALCAFAGPLQRSDIPADPAWLLHADFDALRPTVVGQYILAEMNKPENQNKISAFQGLFKFDLRTQLHGATLYSTGPSPQDAVALVYAGFDAAHLTTLANAAPDSKNAKYKKHVIYNWIDEKKAPRNGVKPRTYAAIAGTRVIFGQREETVQQALDVIDRTVPNLGKTGNYPGLGSPGDVSFLAGGARKIPVPASDPNAAILKMSKSVRLQIAEKDEKVSANLTLEATDADRATQMTTVAQGLVAMLKLQQRPEAVKLADAIALKQEGNSIILKLALPSDELISMMKAGAARKHRKAKPSE